jgi:hypothetical protein
MLTAPVKGVQRSQGPDSRKPFLFRGTVERVNSASGTVDVKNDNILG